MDIYVQCEGYLITFPTACNMTCHEYGECYLTDSYDVGCRCKYGYEEDGVGYCNGRFIKITPCLYI